MNGENLDHNAAVKRTEREFSEMLTNGLDTKDHFVMMIRDVLW